MTALLGRSLILLSLIAATAGAVVAFARAHKPLESVRRTVAWLTYAYCAFITGANLLMVYALLRHDFSVSYVAQVGSRALPTWVTVVSLWSSLEGSILFWGLILGIYIAVATKLLLDRLPAQILYAIGVWLACAAFFSLLIAGPAQPFLTVLHPPADGPGPNPLLQNHILMAVHPPFLYLGYVGMTIPFGLACAALLSRGLEQRFLQPLRNALLIPWTFLSVAIVLGGWWAYEVLGWGGYWAWDPVENASFLPWLTGTAALHSMIVVERRRVLRGWTVTLVLATFLLTILGTFMTRSGVFNSVHSFTQSSIGPTILAFLAVAFVASVVLLALRIDALSAEGELPGLASREAMFLLNNVLFVLFTFTVLIGTVFPLIVEAVNGRQMSVGRPYFDSMAVPIGAALLFLMGVGPALPWGRSNGETVRKSLLPPAAGAALFVIAGLAFGSRNGWTLLTLAFGGFTAFVTVRELGVPVWRRRRSEARGLMAVAADIHLRHARRRFGSHLVHAAVVMMFIAIAVSSTAGDGQEVQLRRGESVRVGQYSLTLLGVERKIEPHRESLVARVGVFEDGRSQGVLAPRMNFYAASREPIGTPDVRTTLTHDLYLSVLNLDPAAQTAGINAMTRPMVVWIWIATALLAVGAFVALLPRRTARIVVAEPAPSPEIAGVAAVQAQK